MVEEIKQSPLLTEEDLHLLSSVPPFSPTHPPHDHTHKWWSHSAWAASFLLPVAVSVYWLLHPLVIVVGVAMTFVLFLAFCRLFSYWSDKTASQVEVLRMEYYSAMDKLLSQLTATIRWLLEIETVSRGLTRPFPSLPSSRLDQCHTHKHLRRCVLQTSAEVLRRLRTTTREICSHVSANLPPEFQEKSSYLAFRKIQELHQFLEEGESREMAVMAGEGSKKMAAIHVVEEITLQALSLESIKVSSPVTPCFLSLSPSNPSLSIPLAQ